MKIDLTNFSAEVVLPIPANAVDPYWYDAARALLLRVASAKEIDGGSWSDVRHLLSEGVENLEGFFPLGLSKAERTTVVSTALFATRWRDLGAL